MYLDPPYVHSTRGSARYRVDASDEHHVALVQALNHLQYARVILSGYDNPLYKQLNESFIHCAFEVHITSGAHEPKTKIESIWKNFP